MLGGFRSDTVVGIVEEKRLQIGIERVSNHYY